MTDMGPVEFMLVEFPGSRFKGDIVPALKELVDAGTIRILDLVFVEKAPDGAVVAVELTDIGADVAAAFEELDGDIGGLLSDEDLELAAEELSAGSSAALLVWENVWASRFVHALREANFELLAHDRIPPEIVAAAIAASDEN